MPVENQPTPDMKKKSPNTEKQPQAGQRRALGPASSSALFRAALTKTLPGYNWTVHKPIGEDLHATGIQSSGSNRCSTIEVRMTSGGKWFESKLAGYGTRSEWLAHGCGSSVAQAMRSLQTSLERLAGIYRSQANTVESARTSQNVDDEPRRA